MPARCSRPDNLTFSTPRPARLTHPYCEYFPPVGCRREPPSHQTLSFRLHLSDTASIELPLDAGESLPARQMYRFHPAAGKAYPTTLPVDCEAFQPLNFTVLSKPVRLGEPQSPDGCRREHSRPDNLSFSSSTLSEAYPSDTESLGLPSDVGQSLPARQTHLFRLLAPQYRTPSNTT